MSSFFTNYPKTSYDLLSDGSNFELTDITRSVILNTSKLQDDNALYTYYEIEDGERPDIVSHKLYGDVEYYWTFFIINDFLRDGYMSSWALSYRNFTKMIDREYAKYSAITLMPVVDFKEDLDGKGFVDISCISLDAKYLPYLKLVSQDREYASSIVKYDSARHQLIVTDCHKIDTDGKRIEIARESFIESSDFSYAIVCDNTMPKSLKSEWLDLIYSQLKKYDPSGYFEHLKLGTARDNYILSKTLRVASKEFRWSNYANAAYEYTNELGNLTSVYDLLSSSRVVYPKYKSFYDYETEINERKRVIQVIRPDFIAEFSDEYFNALNDIES